MRISNTLAVKSIPKVLGYGSLAAVLLGAYDFTGGRLKGWNRDPEQDEFERKQAIRQNRRRPIEETIAEVGEGRGKGYHNKMGIVLTICRSLCARIPREKERENQGELWNCDSRKLSLIIPLPRFPKC